MKATHRIEWTQNGKRYEVIGDFDACCKLYDMLKNVVKSVSMESVQ